ncbi:unnamed protein product [Parnassius mnemosyne]|uniref:THAP-type domain-containing protein n=1 Tax=Parnassius mnemosyne TaxID=213953 RepID=A0AAV1KHP4_9NEOP
MCDQYRKCVKCGVSAAQDPFITFHRFPKIGNGKPETVLRSRIWAEFSFPNQNSADINFLKKLHSSHKMICSRHFAEFAFSNINKMRINKFAIPIDTEHILQRLQDEAGPTHHVEV